MKPDIILLVLDTCRADRLSPYGHGQDLTPALGALADDAVVFERAISPAPWTIPAHASLFTGQYPSHNRTYQAFVDLPGEMPLMAELLRAEGYETAGFCNNPLVGMIDNGFKRGFNRFYNYCGMIPDIPHVGGANLAGKLRERFNRALQRISVPIERQFGRSPLLFKLALMPVFVPVWTKLGSFKGDTQRCMDNVVEYLHYHHRTDPDTPQFVFINLMETHLPYCPPAGLLYEHAPYLKADREASAFLRDHNLNSYLWNAPVAEPSPPKQQAVLSDAYNAEVAYTDQQVHKLLRSLKRTKHLENTLLIVVSDHGESHGEHSFMGHSFVVYDEVVHVPLVMSFPAMFPAGERVAHAVSARRVFHTVLEAAGIPCPADDAHLSLTSALDGRDNDVPGEVVVTEAYPPDNFVRIIEMVNPELIDLFRLLKMRRAVFDGDNKLLTVAGCADEFFDTGQDPAELANLLDQPAGYERQMASLQRQLDRFVEGVGEQGAVHRREYSDDETLLKRLRDLGYIE